MGAEATIRRAAVIGAGTMGAGIAAHLANAGVPVLLLDVAAESGPRDAVAARAIERLRASRPPAFMRDAAADLIAVGNVDDDLERIAEADWIAEAVVERLDVKRELYRRIDAARRPGAMVSSNTSTIPLAMLADGMSPALRRDFLITHFFNPVRYMRLLELVAGEHTRPEVVAALAAFCDVRLGKGVVECRDTPGFLANRVGCFALQVGLAEAVANGVDVETADAIMGRPVGIPKTGVFGLYDLIGLDLMLDVARSLDAALPAGDAFHAVAGGIPAVHALVAAGRCGDKTGAGFYRTVRGEHGPVREALDLDTGDYRAGRRPALDAVDAGGAGGLRALVTYPDACGRYAWRVLARTLAYAASLVPEVADGPAPIDEAMRLGYSWARGPFEMIDELGVAWFRDALAADGIAVPSYLEAAGDGPLYRARDATMQVLLGAGGYADVPRAPGVVRLGDVARVSARLAGNDAASVWDVGEGVACAEFHTKANALGPASMAALREALDVAARDFRALVVYTEAPHFSVGFDLGFALDAIRARAWSRIDEALREFQGTCVALGAAPFPVVAAPAGMALGGGFEVVLGADAVVAHANSVLGLVEPIVGLVPAGGGCAEMLRRWTEDAGDADAALAGALEAFSLIAAGRTASSPARARPPRFLLDRDGETMNRDRLLAEARARAVALAEGYAPVPAPRLPALGAAGARAMVDALDGEATPHDRSVARHLARVLAGGDAPAGATLARDAVLDLEREAFIALGQTPETAARIEHMLATGRPLRN